VRRAAVLISFCDYLLILNRLRLENFFLIEILSA